MRSFFKPVMLAVALSTFGFAGSAVAQDAAAGASAPKIATVNIQAIMRDSTAAKSAREQLEAKQKAYQSEFAKKEEALQKEDQELAKLRTTLSKDAFEAKVKSFREKANSTQKEVASKKQVLDNAFENSISQIQKAVTEIIGELAKEKGFNVALPTSQILYGESSLDISNEVLTRLNQRLAKIDVKFDAPKAAAAAPAAGTPKDAKKQ